MTTISKIFSIEIFWKCFGHGDVLEYDVGKVKASERQNRESNVLSFRNSMVDEESMSHCWSQGFVFPLVF